jgi:hypothetical protein
MTATLDKRAEDLVIAILAELATEGVDTLGISDRSIHDRFGKALEKLREDGGEISELARKFYKNVVTDTYDELDHSLIAAEQFGFVKFPNPSYSRATIAITPRMAYRLLKSWPPEQRESIQRAAAVMKDRSIT